MYSVKLVLETAATSEANKCRWNVIFVMVAAGRGGCTIELTIRNIGVEVSQRSEIKYQGLLEPRLNLSEGRKLTKASTEAAGRCDICQPP